MVQSEDQNKKIKQDIKTSWAEGDLLGLIRAGFDGFLNMLYSNAPLPFQKFLEYTGASFDHYILDICHQEQLSYVGGKMILALDRNVDPNAENTPVTIRLSADFYFQTHDKKWIVKKKNGQVDSKRFADWDTDPEVAKLRTNGTLELSIEPPKPEAK